MTEPIKVVAQVVMDFMKLDEQHCLVGKPKWNIPPDDGIYVVLSYLGSKPIGIKSDVQPVSHGGLLETMSSTVRHEIQVDVLSFSTDARVRKEEVPMALRCIAMQQAMEANNLQVARSPLKLADASSLEETQMLSRFVGTLALTALHVKAPVDVDYYDTFEQPEVKVNE